ncbi:hypothetical protein QJ48_09425 [Paenibacillus sp. A3]|uniref:DUF4097 family beta strand repeat-containing protein n=1 Tax=Paenibacillus sp. A3 TaxID=1337054 RepID=UPI0006D546FA|nr:DUF4097 family beta strand repeat-containing protein [Paenibacillus sp. A3]KPV59709.1 hypothetical protein QJ48_09425 [Paenibacillus sp. A3]
MKKVGRYTSALALLLIGALILLDRTMETEYLHLAIGWWPVVLVAFGAELLAFKFHRREKRGRLNLDFGGMLLTVLVLWGLSFFAPASSSVSSSTTGYRIAGGISTVALSEQTDSLVIDNPAGNVVVKPGPVDKIQIDASLWAETPAASHDFKISSKEKDGKITVTTRGGLFGLSNKNKPFIHLLVTVPEQRKLDMQLKLKSGDVEARRLPIRKQLTVETSNGKVTVSDIAANVLVRTTDTQVQADHIQGDTEMHVSGGSIRLSEAGGKVSVVASNGPVMISGSSVGGDWNVDSKQGDITVEVPAQGDFRIDGSSPKGRVIAGLPMNVTANAATGTVGSGAHLIRLHAANGNIAINEKPGTGQGGGAGNSRAAGLFSKKAAKAA